MNNCWAPHSEMCPKHFTVVTIALFFASEHTHCALVVCDWMGDSARFWLFTPSVTTLFGCYMAGVTWTALSRRTFCVLTQSCTSFLQCRVIRSHRRRVYVCLVVTCHMHFWENDMDLLHATAVTRGWNKHRNESQHRKLTLEKNILPPLAFLPRLEPETFRSRVRSFTTELFPLRACHHRSKSVIGKYICQNSSHTQIPFLQKNL